MHIRLMQDAVECGRHEAIAGSGAREDAANSEKIERCDDLRIGIEGQFAQYAGEEHADFGQGGGNDLIADRGRSGMANDPAIAADREDARFVQDHFSFGRAATAERQGHVEFEPAKVLTRRAARAADQPAVDAADLEMHRERSRLADGGGAREVGAKEFHCRMASDADARGAQRERETNSGAETGDVEGLRGARDGPCAETGGEDGGHGTADIGCGQAAENGMNLEAGAGCDKWIGGWRQFVGERGRVG